MTSRGILTAIILIAGLSFGRQVLRWWSEDDAAPVQAPSELAGLGDPQSAHRLQFGRQQWTMVRQSFVGTAKEAGDILSKTCARATRDAPAPTHLPGPAQENLLAKLAGQSPAAEEPGVWQVHQLEGDVPMAVGLRRWPDESETTPGKGFGVVAWGIGLPVSSDAWTLYTFVSGKTPISPGAEGPNVPIPQEGEPLLAIAAEGGTGMVTFRGKGNLAAWQAFYDQWAAREGWQRVSDWQETDRTVRARYGADDVSGGGWVDVRLSDQGDGTLSGLLVLTPGEKQNGEGNPRP
ncbi:MAG: hypothetical protein JW818_17665 [Pirellulales bacterium]|nr:hypothetical protein [Pirellulales bacterium]